MNESKERWVVYQADQYEEEWFRYLGRPDEERGVSPASLSDEQGKEYDRYTHGSAAVEVFIDTHAMEMPSPLARIIALEAEVERLTRQLARQEKATEVVYKRVAAEAAQTREAHATEVEQLTADVARWASLYQHLAEAMATARATLVAGKERT